MYEHVVSSCRQNDGIERGEDKAIAWTWKRFYNESHAGIDNPEILLRMPMCKVGLSSIQYAIIDKTDQEARDVGHIVFTNY